MNPCRARSLSLIDSVMAESPAHRIEEALARIERAAAARAYATERLARRHAKLRARIEEAVTSLDALIARETPGAEQG
jgi:hypothetical protein